MLFNNFVTIVGLLSASIAAQSTSGVAGPSPTGGVSPSPSSISAPADGAINVPSGDVDSRCPSPFAQCKADIRAFELTTCIPLGSRNASLVNICRCYQAVNLANCYLLCQDPQVSAELNGQVNPTITSVCGAVGLNPRALPQPAPWQTAGLSVSGSVPTGSARPAIATSGSSPSGTASPSPSGRSAAVQGVSSTMLSYVGSSLLVMMAGLMF